MHRNCNLKAERRGAADTTSKSKDNYNIQVDRKTVRVVDSQKATHTDYNRHRLPREGASAGLLSDGMYTYRAKIFVATHNAPTLRTLY
jgi:hypothetical protein